MSLPHLYIYAPYVLRLLLAFVIGGAIGFERELHGRPAGLRTHILVCLGSCLIASVDSLLPNSGGRIAAQIVTGVGFLGAGTILRGDRGASVHGLTTAASLWCVAGIGLALGYGGMATWLAISSAAIILVTLTLINLLERLAIHHSKERALIIYLRSPDDAAASTASSTVLDALANLGVKIRSVEIEQPDSSPLTKVMNLRLNMADSTTPEQVSSVLCDNPQVSQFDWVH